MMKPGLAAVAALALALAAGAAQAGTLSELRDFGANPGALDMRIYTPDTVRTPAVLVAALHGCEQGPEFAGQAGWETLADKHGFVLLLPRQTRANNAMACFNWFHPDHNVRDKGEAKSIADAVTAVARRHGVESGRTFITGFSAGAAMTVAMLAEYPELFAGGGVVGGIPYACVSKEVMGTLQWSVAPYAMMGLECMKTSKPRHVDWKALVKPARPAGLPLRLSLWQGEDDDIVWRANLDELVEQWTEVLGLRRNPARLPSPGHRAVREVYGDPVSAVAIETVMIPGMGHGVPVAASAGCGMAATYAPDVGICSSLDQLRFWGVVQ
jgi:poly(hydroxyalkanoate) depolymerase family esterase